MDGNHPPNHEGSGSQDPQCLASNVLPNVQQVPPNVQQVPPNVEQVPTNVQQVPPNVEQVPTNVQQVPPNVQQVPPNDQQVPPNVHQVGIPSNGSAQLNRVWIPMQISLIPPVHGQQNGPISAAQIHGLMRNQTLIPPVHGQQTGPISAAQIYESMRNQTQQAQNRSTAQRCGPAPETLGKKKVQRTGRAVCGCIGAIVIILIATGIGVSQIRHNPSHNPGYVDDECYRTTCGCNGIILADGSCACDEGYQMQYGTCSDKTGGVKILCTTPCGCHGELQPNGSCTCDEGYHIRPSSYHTHQGTTISEKGYGDSKVELQFPDLNIGQCEDNNECLASPCPSNMVCENNIGGYFCKPEELSSCGYGHYHKDPSCTGCNSPYEKQCKNGKCVAALLWCNGGKECTDWSDELDCLPGCKQHQSRCDEGLTCLPYKHYKDGHKDCYDGSDELGDILTAVDIMDIGCKTGYEECHIDMRCIHSTYFCDGIHDCPDRSDELNCDQGVNHKFTCDLIKVLPRRKWCDGNRDCNDGSDERPDCQCLIGQRRCDNNRCVEDVEWCNGLDECGDQSDETNCVLDCGYRHERCGDKCINRKQVCDGNIDCDDQSDEMNCPGCNTDGFRFSCDNGACIRSVFVCNGIDDCTDGSDERNCDYCIKEGNFVCKSNDRCIPKFTVCDGENDCPDGEDELNCTGLACFGKFQCADGSCISKDKVCDQTVDCSGGEDENHCVHLEKVKTVHHSNVSHGNASSLMDPHSNDTHGNTSLLMIHYHGNWYPVCSRNSTDGLGESVCINLEKSYGDSMEARPLPVNWRAVTSRQGWMTLTYDGSKLRGAFLSNFVHVEECLSGYAIYMACNEPANHNHTYGCGQRSENLAVSYIIGGKQALPGMWPWQVQLYHQDEFTCGGSIISDRWILTAAHCVAHDHNATNYKVKAGTSKRSGVELNARVYEIEKVIQNQFYVDSTLVNDIALLKTTSTIVYSDYIRPVCLPQSNHDYTRSRRCYVTGWGVYTHFRALPDNLRQMRVQILPPNQCQGAMDMLPAKWHFLKVIEDKMICMSYDVADSCYGDSGGPMVCRQRDDSFVQLGLNSWHVPPHCQSYHITTNITTYIDWVKAQTGLDFN